MIRFDHSGFITWHIQDIIWMYVYPIHFCLSRNGQQQKATFWNVEYYWIFSYRIINFNISHSSLLCLTFFFLSMCQLSIKLSNTYWNENGNGMKTNNKNVSRNKRNHHVHIFACTYINVYELARKYKGTQARMNKSSWVRRMTIFFPLIFILIYICAFSFFLLLLTPWALFAFISVKVLLKKYENERAKSGEWK